MYIYKFCFVSQDCAVTAGLQFYACVRVGSCGGELAEQMVAVGVKVFAQSRAADGKTVPTAYKCSCDVFAAEGSLPQ